MRTIPSKAYKFILEHFRGISVNWWMVLHNKHDYLLEGLTFLMVLVG